MHLFAPSYRPQEFLQLHAYAAMVSAINALGQNPATGADIDLLVCTGDMTDNCQLNELRWAVALLEGSDILPFSGGPQYEGVSSVAWGDAAYWHPDRYDGIYKLHWGFPTLPGLLEDACQPFAAPGTSRPWISCLGNHDALVQGTAVYTPEFKRRVIGKHKVFRLHYGFNALSHIGEYIQAPERFLAGPAHEVTTDPLRRSFSRTEFVQIHRAAPGNPPGHGFGTRTRVAARTNYVDDSHAGIRLIVLDTVNASGNYHGSIGKAQLEWLQRRLAEVHSQYYDTKGRRVRTSATDRLVVLLSHHGIDSLVNDMVTPGGETDLPRVLGPQFEAQLHRFPSVVLWVNGHTHRNTITPRPDRSGKTGGFWEVTTTSLIDWPGQARLIELVSNGDGTLSVLCTMVDHAAAADPAKAGGPYRLASIHRELAANDPHCGVKSGFAGTPADRNVELVLPAPFGMD